MNRAGATAEWADRIEVFHYPPIACSADDTSWAGFADVGDAGVSVGVPQGHIARGPAEGNTEVEQRLAEEARRSFEAGRERGRQEGRQAEREAHAAAHVAAEENRARQAVDLVAAFVEARDRYLHAVEHEVVKLALAVAARILRREAQMDPLLLTGAVRVALGQLGASTKVRLRVPPADLELWTDAAALLPNLSLKPQVVAGEGMRLGDCVVETELGSVDLGVRSQLGEIERGFFDRAGGGQTQPVKRPQPAAAGAEF